MLTKTTSIALPPEQMANAFYNCINLTSLYLDLRDINQFAVLLRFLHLPALAHLHMPFVTDPLLREIEDNDAKTQLFTEFLERHQKTLVVFHLLNALEDRQTVWQLWTRVRNWLGIEEIRVDCYNPRDYLYGIPPGSVWTRTADFLSTDGRDDWVRGLCRARLDRLDLCSIDERSMFDYTWQKLKILVLNPHLILHFGPLPEANAHSSVRAQELEKKHMLGSMHSTSQEECEEKKVAERIIRQTKSHNIRMIFIRQFRFWIDHESTPHQHRPSQKVWYLRDALQDEVQSRHIKEKLNQRDWEFLSDRGSKVTDGGANTVTFFRTPQLQSD
jgi:hypothetical protein